MRVLVVEDDRDLVEVLRRSLKKVGLVVEARYEGAEALELLAMGTPIDVVILDLGLPGLTGRELLPKIKKLKPNLPVLALTGQADEGSVIGGLELGFDDYLTKPFAVEELVARIRVLYRSFGRKKTRPNLRIGGLSIDTAARIVHIGKRTLKLTGKEYGVLVVLVKNQDSSVGARAIVERVWDRNVEETKSRLATTVSRLRRKIEGTGVKISWEGAGYKIYENK